MVFFTPALEIDKPYNVSYLAIIDIASPALMTATRKNEQI